MPTRVHSGVSGAEEPVEQSESPAHRPPQFSLEECVCTSVPVEADFVILERRAFGVGLRR